MPKTPKTRCTWKVANILLHVDNLIVKALMHYTDIYVTFYTTKLMKRTNVNFIVIYFPFEIELN